MNRKLFLAVAIFPLIDGMALAAETQKVTLNSSGAV